LWSGWVNEHQDFGYLTYIHAEAHPQDVIGDVGEEVLVLAPARLDQVL
jgi:hypothetical protein